MATVNMYRKYREVWTCGFWNARVCFQLLKFYLSRLKAMGFSKYAP